MNKEKSLTFRPTKKNQEKIEYLMKICKIKSKSNIIIKSIYFYYHSIKCYNVKISLKTNYCPECGIDLQIIKNKQK